VILCEAVPYSGQWVVLCVALLSCGQCVFLSEIVPYSGQ